MAPTTCHWLAYACVPGQPCPAPCEAPQAQPRVSPGEGPQSHSLLLPSLIGLLDSSHASQGPEGPQTAPAQSLLQDPQL